MDNFSYMFRFKSRVVPLIAVLTLTAGCLPRGTDMADMYEAEPGTFTQVDFAILSANVLQPKCMTCHPGFATESGLLPYFTGGDPDHSPLFTDVESGAMPPGGPKISDNAIDIVRTYVLDK